MKTDRAFLDDQLNFSDDRGITDATTHGTKELVTSIDLEEKIILKVLYCLKRIQIFSVDWCCLGCQGHLLCRSELVPNPAIEWRSGVILRKRRKIFLRRGCFSQDRGNTCYINVSRTVGIEECCVSTMLESPDWVLEGCAKGLPEDQSLYLV